jgi:translation initiation factor 3 subunit I
MSEYTIVETKQFRGCGFMTVCKYNNMGDIIYIGDKDSKIITAVDTQDYNIIGTFSGHNGVIWSLDISKNDDILISASGDLTIGFFSAKRGDKLYQSSEKCIPKFVCAQKNNPLQMTNLVGIICEAITKKSSTYISIYDLDTIGMNDFKEKIKLIWSRQSKPTVLSWLSNNELIIGCDDGKIIIRNINDIDGSKEKEYQIHSSSIKSIVWNKNYTQILTGSSDCTAKQIDVNVNVNVNGGGGFNILNTYKSTVPINFAIWNHNNKKVIIGGGIEAMNVAKTSDNDLNVKIYRSSDQKLTNHIGSHFGPIRFIDKSPSNKNFMTASQDGSVKIYFITDTESNTESNIIQKESDKQIGPIGPNEPKTFIRFGDGLICNNTLTNETNKIINLSWKPPKVKEQPIQKWIPGMPIPKDSNDNSIYSANKTSDLDDKLYEIKKEQNSTIRITNLPSYVRVKDLNDLFDLYGRIEERNGIKIKVYPDSTMAFIKYMYPESALKAIDNMDGYSMDRYIMRVELAIQK